MAALSPKPRRETAEVVVLLEQQDGPSRLGEYVGRRQPGETRADDDDVVILFDAFETIPRHMSQFRYGGAKPLS